MNLQKSLDWLRRLFMVLAVVFEAVGYVSGSHTKLIAIIACIAVVILAVWFCLVIFSEIIIEKQNEVK